MHYAVSNDNARCLKVLVDNAETTVNIKDARLCAPLHLAIRSVRYQHPPATILCFLRAPSCMYMHH